MHRISGRIPTEIIGFSGGLIFLFTTNKRIRYTYFVMFISTDDSVKLFPRECQPFVDEVQAIMKILTIAFVSTKLALAKTIFIWRIYGNQSF